MSKKGLSGIVTVILFILLILVAIGIVWAFLNPFIGEGASEVASVGDCLQVRLEATSCSGNSPTDYNVTVSRGADSSNLGAIKLIFYDADDNTEVIQNNTIPSAPGSRTYANHVLTSITGAVKVGAIAVLDIDGELKTCDQISELRTCTQAA